MSTERLAELLHDADSRMHPVLSGYAPEPCDYHRAMARALERQGVRVGDDAGGLRAAAQDVVLQEGTYRRTISGTGRIDVVADPALAVVPKVALDRLRAALAAQSAPPALTAASPEAAGLDRERLAWALHTVDDDIQFLRRDTRNFPVLAGRLADAYEAAARASSSPARAARRSRARG